MADLRYIGLILGLVSISYASESCPPQKIGSACTCSNRDSLRVSCLGVKDPSTLLRDVQYFRGYNLTSLHLMNISLPYLPAGLFLGMSVKQFFITHSTLENLYSVTDYSPSPFAGLEDSLEEFKIYLVKSSSKWYYPDLTGLKRLKKVDFVFSPVLDNFVGSVFGDIGKGSLEVISVIKSDISRIHPQAFSKNKNLKEVIFRGNFIPYMVRLMFPEPANFLRKIDLAGNKLFRLPENMFDNMPSLEHLDLSENEFKTFQFMPAYNNLKYFYIMGNPFECGCHLLPLTNMKTTEDDLQYVECTYPESNSISDLRDLSDQLIHCY